MSQFRAIKSQSHTRLDQKWSHSSCSHRHCMCSIADKQRPKWALSSHSLASDLWSQTMSVVIYGWFIACEWLVSFSDQLCRHLKRITRTNRYLQSFNYIKWERVKSRLHLSGAQELAYYVKHVCLVMTLLNIEMCVRFRQNVPLVSHTCLWFGQKGQIHNVDGHRGRRRLPLQVPQLTVGHGGQGRPRNAQTHVHPPRLAEHGRAVDAKGSVLPQTQAHQQHRRQARIREYWSYHDSEWPAVDLTADDPQLDAQVPTSVPSSQSQRPLEAAIQYIQDIRVQRDWIHCSHCVSKRKGIHSYHWCDHRLASLISHTYGVSIMTQLTYRFVISFQR